MERPYIEDKLFEKIVFAENPLQQGDYEYCRFEDGDLSYADLSGYHFTECLFTGCNLSMAKLQKTSLNGVQFRDCKLMGLHFEDCDSVLFSANFDHCQLDFSSFFQLKMKKTVFNYCSLKEADFTETDLSAAVFEHCELVRAIFEHTILEKTDFRTSFHYSIDPARNTLKKTKVSSAGLAGFLDQYDLDID
eukprot:Opistho-1_new@56759